MKLPDRQLQALCDKEVPVLLSDASLPADVAQIFAEYMLGEVSPTSLLLWIMGNKTWHQRQTAWGHIGLAIGFSAISEAIPARSHYTSYLALKRRG